MYDYELNQSWLNDFEHLFYSFFSIDCLSLRLQARGIFGSFSGHHMRTAFEFYNSVIIIIRILKTVILASYNGEKSYKVE